MSIDKRRAVCLGSVDATPCGTWRRHYHDKFDCTLENRYREIGKQSRWAHWALDLYWELFSAIFKEISTRLGECVWVIWLEIDFHSLLLNERALMTIVEMKFFFQASANGNKAFSIISSQHSAVTETTAGVGGSWVRHEKERKVGCFR